MVQADTTSIARGITEAGRGIGDSLAKRASDMKRQQEEDKRKAEDAKETRAMAGVLREKLGLSHSQIQESDAASLKGTINGYMREQDAEVQKLQRQRNELAILGMKTLQRDAESRREIPKQLVEGFKAQEQAIPSPWNNEMRSEKMTAATGMPPGVRELIGAHANAGLELPPAVMEHLVQQQGRSPAMGPGALAALGFLPTGGQLNPNGSASINFGPKPPPTPGSIVPIPTEGGGESGKGLFGDKIVDIPTDRSKSLTDAQANALQYSERMKFNNDVLHKLESTGFDPSGVGAAVQEWTPNFLATEDFQKYDAARRNWVSAVLRKESGAAISKSEEAGAVNQYFPKLGDSRGTVAQKAALRILAEENMRKAVGEIKRDKPSKEAAPKLPPGAEGKSHEQLIQEANEALKAGAPAAAVRARLKKLGVEIK